MDKYVLSDAIKRYISLKERDIPKLTEYAKKFRVQKILHGYLEVLL